MAETAVFRYLGRIQNAIEAMTMTKHSADRLDPIRKLILDRATELRLSLTDLSRGIGRNDAYVHQFIWRGSPRRLPELERAALAAMLHVAESELREPGAAVPPGVIPPPAVRGAAPARQLPVYQEGGEFAPGAAVAAVAPPVLDPNVTAGVWVSRDHQRVRSGDMVFIRENAEPRAGDVVVLVTESRIAAIGDLDSVQGGEAQIESRTYPLDRARIYKVAYARYA